MLWRRLAWGALVTAVLVAISMFVLDGPMYIWTHGIGQWGIWRFLGHVFDAKVWILVTVVVFAVYGVKRLIKTIESIKNKQIK